MSFSDAALLALVLASVKLVPEFEASLFQVLERKAPAVPVTVLPVPTKLTLTLCWARADESPARATAPVRASRRRGEVVFMAVSWKRAETSSRRWRAAIG